MGSKLKALRLFFIVVALIFSSITVPNVDVFAQDNKGSETSKNAFKLTIDLNEGKYNGSNEDVIHYLDFEEPTIDLSVLPSMEELTNDNLPGTIATGYVDEFNVPIKDSTILTKDTTIYVQWKTPENTNEDNITVLNDISVASATNKVGGVEPLSYVENYTVSVGQEVTLDPHNRDVPSIIRSCGWDISDTSIINVTSETDTRFERTLEFTALKPGKVEVAFYYTRALASNKVVLQTYMIEIVEDDTTSNEMNSKNIKYVENNENKHHEFVDEAVVEEYIQLGYTDFSWQTNEQNIGLVSSDVSTRSATISLSNSFFSTNYSQYPSVSFQSSKETTTNAGSVKITTIVFKKYYALAYAETLRPDASDELVNGLKPGELSISKDAQWVSTEDEMIAEISFDIHGVPIATGSDIIIILDNSGSMDLGERGVAEDDDPFVIAQAAVSSFAEGLFANDNDQNHRIAFVEFSTELDDSFTFENNLNSFDESFHKATYFYDNRDIPAGGTNYEVALQRAEFYFDLLSYEELEKERPKHIVFISDGLPNEGYEAIAEANRLRDSGVTIHTIGIKLDEEGKDALWKITSTPVYHVEDIETELSPVLDLIASGIRYAARDAVITDYIDDHDFEIIDTEEYPLSDNIYTDGEEVRIDVGTVTAHTKPVSFYVRYIGENDGALHRTNQEALIEYIDVDGNEGYKGSLNQRGDPIIEGEERYTGLDSPLLPVPPSGMINIVYYYLDDTGNAFISEASDSLSTIDMNFAKNIKSIYQDSDGNQVLDLNSSYTINGVAPEGYIVSEKTINGVEYTSSNTVTITNDNITPTVTFILEKEPEPTGLINIEYYYLNETGTEFICEDDETTSTTDITKAKKLSYVYEDSTGNSVLPLETTHIINGAAPEGYKVVEKTVNGIDYTMSNTVTITETNLTPTVSFVLEKEPTGLINIEYYYLNETGTEFICEDDETTSTTDITKAKKLSYVYEDSTGNSVLPLETTHIINGAAPEGYKVVEKTVNGIDYTMSNTVTITETNLTPTVSFVLEKEPTGLINIEYYYLNEACTEFICEDDETTSTTDITRAKKLNYVYEDSTGNSVLPLETTHIINGVAPEGYKVVEKTVNGIDYTMSNTVTITETNLTPTVSFVLEKDVEEPTLEEGVEKPLEIPTTTTVKTGDSTSIVAYLMIFAGTICVFGIVFYKNKKRKK